MPSRLDGSWGAWTTGYTPSSSGRPKSQKVALLPPASASTPPMQAWLRVTPCCLRRSYVWLGRGDKRKRHRDVSRLSIAKGLPPLHCPHLKFLECMFVISSVSVDHYWTVPNKIIKTLPSQQLSKCVANHLVTSRVCLHEYRKYTLKHKGGASNAIDESLYKSVHNSQDMFHGNSKLCLWNYLEIIQ